jgi:hypothetical protein
MQFEMKIIITEKGYMKIRREANGNQGLREV